MSIYKDLTPNLPCYRIEAGWHQPLRSYFLRAFEDEDARKPKPFLELGICDSSPLPLLYDLVNYSWSLVDWQKEIPVLRQLAIDPILEEHRSRVNKDAAMAGDDSRVNVAKLIRVAYQSTKTVDLSTNPVVKRSEPAK